VSCDQGTNPQSSVVVYAKYKVLNDKSIEVEQYLVKHFQLPNVTFACCGFESHSVGGYTDKSGKSINIRMAGSSKEGNDDYSRVRKDNQFTVSVEWWIEGP